MDALARPPSTNQHDPLVLAQILDKTAGQVDENLAALAATQARMDAENAGLVASFCEILTLLVLAVLIFFCTYVAIRFLPARAR